MAPTTPLKKPEFIALMAAMYAVVALSIDSMLPALPEIAGALSPEAPNRAQLVVTAFVFGLGLGTLFVGPLSDALGRRPIMLAGAALFTLGALGCYLAPSLPLLLGARIVMGLGAAAARVVSGAMIRDLFKGRDMAHVMSMVMTVFMVVPALAPLMGQGVIALAGWKAIFLALMAVAAVVTLWLSLRQPETLPAPARRRVTFANILAGLRDMAAHRIVWLSILMQALISGSLFATLSSLQGIFDQQFDRGASFPLWFGLTAVLAIPGSMLNTRHVQRLGMRKMAKATLVLLFSASVVLALSQAVALPQSARFVVLILWAAVMFGSIGPTMGNLNALAMEPLGHIAGLASSAIAAASTVLSVCLAVPVGQMFNGTAMPLALGVAGFIGAALLIFQLDKGR